LTAGVTAGFLFASYNISRMLQEDPFVLAANENNRREEEFIKEYMRLYKSSKEKGLILPNNLIV